MPDWASHVQVLTGILAIVNPIGAIPLFLGLLGEMPAPVQKSAARTTALTVAAVLLGSMLVGKAVLEAFGIRMASFQAGGGILIVLMAISMLHAKRSGASHTEEESAEAGERESVAITPLGIPLLAGPGSISAVILYAHQARDWAELGWLALSIGLVSVAVWVALRLALPISSALGQIGVNIVTRLMGLLLVAVGVEFIARGLSDLFPAALGVGP
jgi:multiple antibiotic resistance protein